MELIKKLWFYSFKVEKKNVSSFVANLIIWVVASVLAGIVLWLAGAIAAWIPVVGKIIGALVGILGAVTELYCTVGIVLAILIFVGVLKD